MKKHKTANLFNETHDGLEFLIEHWVQHHADKDGFVDVFTPSKAKIVHLLVADKVREIKEKQNEKR